MANVYFRRSSYEYAALREDVMALLGSIEPDCGGRPGRGDRVLVKPNLLTASSPGQAIVTHPLVVRAACEYALSKGARVTVGDSPPLGRFERLLKKTGLLEALAGLDVELVELNDSREVEVRGGGRWRRMEFSARALDADMVINLPKLKTHCQMGLTLSVKNMFGCVVGLRKPQWHFRVGENRELFAELIAVVHNEIGPRMNLMDGILAMEGDGPGSGGVPRELGVLAASADAVSLDMCVTRILGKPEDWLLTSRASWALRGGRPETIAHGDIPRVAGYDIPAVRDIMMGPGLARGFFRRHITDRPECLDPECRLCGECMKICPAGAIAKSEKSSDGVRFDHSRCIRCYCCLEVCPHKAIERRETVLKKTVRTLFG